MPAAGVTAKLSPPPDSAELPTAVDRHAPPTPTGRAELPPSPECCEPFPSPDAHEAPTRPDRAELPPPFPLDFDPVREALCSAGPVAAAWAAQDAELDAEIAALEAAGVLTAPAEEELPGPGLDPDCLPPRGLRPREADLSGSPLDEYFPAITDATSTEMPRARRRDRFKSGELGFAAGEDADVLPPGAALAGLAEDARAAGLSRLTDDELAGVIRAGRRLSSWASALELVAVSDLMRRREQQEAAGHPHAAEHVDAEIAALLMLTGRGAGRVLDLAIALRRLPLTARALEAGVIDLPRVSVIADETTGLDDDHAAAVEQHVLVRAPGQTTSQVRAAARRAVIAADPRAARKRQEQAQREARVERWDEHAGTAALAGRDLPPAAVIAADQHISALARGLRAAGLAGTADQLRAQAFLALLSGTPASSLLPAGQQQPGSAANGSSTSADPGLPGQPGMPGNSGEASSPVPRGGPGSAASATPGWPAIPVPGVPASADSPGFPANTDSLSTPANAGWPGLPAVAGTVNLTMPLSTWLGFRDAPGDVSGFGPLTADDSRHLGTAMAGHPQTRWCVTLTGEDGRPVAHGCARAGHGPPPPAPGPAPSAHGTARPAHACESPVYGPAPPEHGSGPPERGLGPPEHGPGPLKHGPGPPRHGSRPPDHGSEAPDHGPGPPAWLASIVLKWFESAGCAHERQSAAYRPPPTLQHLIRVRQQTCAFPGCRRPASQCDLDHTTPFQCGGLTCECNLSPLCRRHHEAKQAPGWHLSQDQPGVMTWRLPSGRIYATCAGPYHV